MTRSQDQLARPSAALAVLSWWGGFFGGPLTAIIVYLVSERDPLSRSHARAAAVAWGAVLVVWVPISLGTILFSSSDSGDRLFVAAPILVVAMIVLCTAGTVQARRGRSLRGGPVAPSA